MMHRRSGVQDGGYLAVSLAGEELMVCHAFVYLLLAAEEAEWGEHQSRIGWLEVNRYNMPESDQSSLRWHCVVPNSATGCLDTCRNEESVLKKWFINLIN